MRVLVDLRRLRRASAWWFAVLRLRPQRAGSIGVWRMDYRRSGRARARCSDRGVVLYYGIVDGGWRGRKGKGVCRRRLLQVSWEKMAHTHRGRCCT